MQVKYLMQVHSYQIWQLCLSMKFTFIVFSPGNRVGRGQFDPWYWHLFSTDFSKLQRFDNVVLKYLKNILVQSFSRSLFCSNITCTSAIFFPLISLDSRDLIMLSYLKRKIYQFEFFYKKCILRYYYLIQSGFLINFLFIHDLKKFNFTIRFFSSVHALRFDEFLAFAVLTIFYAHSF